MREYYPLLILGAIIGVLSLCFVLAYAMMKNKKEAIGFDRNMKDSEIARRLLRYAKPHVGKFVFVGFVMLFSISRAPRRAKWMPAKQEQCFSWIFS